jgi:hypothetical protein
MHWSVDADLQCFSFEVCSFEVLSRTVEVLLLQLHSL